jgi:mono/diheme cytochrome c family protein
MTTVIRKAFALIAAFCVSPAALAQQPVTKQPAAEREFTLKVLPLLKAKCYGCHGDDPEDIQGALDVRDRDSLLRGGESEEASIVPGDPDASPLFQSVKWEGIEMPPKENDRLSEAEVELIRRWIAAGAPWPDEEAQQKHRQQEWAVESTDEGVIVKTSGGLSGDWTFRRYQPEDVWAFRPAQQMELPDGSHPIDFMVGERLKQASAEAAPQADPRTLVRRATFDLVGLPPTPEEVQAFQAAWKADPEVAWSDLVDRLLASPHYGERWGQHWIDVTRYADTSGFSNDYERSNMWRYRDYVIRAFNDDKPYDEFVLEQLAGDEIWQQQPVGERDPELLVATGFVRMGPWDPAMVKNPEARQLFIDDAVNAVGQTFLSTTLRCVKCHDHKFDPIPTRDYYRIYAAFSGTQMAERPAPFLPEEKLEGFEQGRELTQRLLDFAASEKNALYDKRETAARQWYEEHDLEYVSHADRKNLPDEMKPPRHVGLDHVDQGRLKVREQDEWIWNRRLERYQPLAQSVYNGPDPGFLNARKLRMPAKVDKSTQLVSYILTGGSLEAPGEQVQPGVMSALGVPVRESEADPYVIGDQLEGRRLALAKWIADARNPLTARSIVNRIWQHHFGKAIAGNPNNFGAKGDKPTHPELLDWLAVDFVEQGWTIKRLHKLIMTSQVYRQASGHPQIDSLRRSDPNNDLLAYFPTRRLTAEEVRDAILRITGELNPAVGGLPVMPEINMEVALQPRMIQFSIAPAYQPSRTPQQRNRRSVYAYRVRGQADPFLEVFNQPNPNESCEERDVAAVSPQAFTLMNSELMNDRAISFALRLEGETAAVDDQVKRAFELALGRQPSADEQQRMTQYVERMQGYHEGVRPDPVHYPTRITRSLVEEFTGRPFEYEEILPVFEDYRPDPKPSDVASETRALADLCLLLLNSNEFLFIY